MSQNMMVSVICNTYNHGPYVRDALEGFVMQQTSFPFEVLVHDDASTDNTADIIREYEAKYPEIIKPIYQTENQYSQKVRIDRTFQIPRITGKYVAVCEGDDYWTDPMKLQKQVDFLESHPDYSLCACSTVWLDMTTGKSISLSRTETDRDIPAEELILEKRGRIFQYATLLIRADLFIHRPEWMREFRVGDLPLMLHAVANGKVRMLADAMVVYRYRSSGSWTARIAQDVSYKTAMMESMIRGLTAFDQATDHRFSASITKRILSQKYLIARSQRDLKALRSGELRQIYLSRPFAARMSDILACKAPKLKTLIRRMLGRI